MNDYAEHILKLKSSIHHLYDALIKNKNDEVHTLVSSIKESAQAIESYTNTSVH